MPVPRRGGKQRHLMDLQVHGLTDTGPDQSNSHVGQYAKDQAERSVPSGPLVGHIDPTRPKQSGDMDLGKDFFFGTTTQCTHSTLEHSHHSIIRLALLAECLFE